MGLRLSWGHRIHWFIGSRNIELGSVRDLCRSSLFRLDAFNVLELCELTSAPFSWPGGAVCSLGIGNTYKEIQASKMAFEAEKKMYQHQGSPSSFFCACRDLLAMYLAGTTASEAS